MISLFKEIFMLIMPLIVPFVLFLVLRIIYKRVQKKTGSENYGCPCPLCGSPMLKNLIVKDGMYSCAKCGYYDSNAD